MSFTSVEFNGKLYSIKACWVKENEPEIFEKIDKIMLPGDYIAMRLSGQIGMTIEGLSEGIFWDFKNNCISEDIINHYGIPESFFRKLYLHLVFRATVSKAASEELGLKEGTPISYRAGDQPNNALSLNVFNPEKLPLQQELQEWFMECWTSWNMINYQGLIHLPMSITHRNRSGLGFYCVSTEPEF